jgi:hypothetical protein
MTAPYSGATRGVWISATPRKRPHKDQFLTTAKGPRSQST